MKVMLAAILFCCVLRAKAAHPDSLAHPPGNLKQVSILYQNDFFNSSDYYFTQGVELDLVFPFIKKSPVSKLLISAGRNSINDYGLFFRQECFTPTSISRDTVSTGDRPFAATLYLGHRLASSSADKKSRVTTEFIFGILGPCAGCKETQEKIHQWLDNIQPQGWQYQVSSSLVLNYSAKYEKLIFNKNYFEGIASLDLSAGTLYTNGGGGLLLRAGKMNSYFEATPEDKFLIYGFVTGTAHGILYNATLQGSLFNNESIYTIPSGDIERIVFSATGGVVAVYHRLELEYSRTFLTPEFENGLSHGWGNIRIAVRL